MSFLRLKSGFTRCRWVLPGIALALGSGNLRANPTTLAGEIRDGQAPSPILHASIAYRIYLPPGYLPGGQERYPVIYLLHGRGDNMAAWRAVMPELEQLITGKRIPPLLAVMVDAPFSERAGYYIDSEFTGNEAGRPAGAPVESAFTKDLITHIDATFPTRPDRRGRIVAGYSMGGYGALRYALAHPELFAAAIVLSPAVYFPLPPPDSSTREFGAFGKSAQRFDSGVYTSLNYPATIPAFVAKRLPVVMFIAVGDDEPALADPAEAAHDLDYEAHTLYNRIRRVPEITAQFRVVNGGHNWETWRPTFVEGVQYVFRALQSTTPKPAP